MTLRHVAGASVLLLAATLISGCDSLPSIPYINEKPAEQQQEAAKPAATQTPQSKPMSRSERIAKGLSEELDWFPSLDEPLEQLQATYASDTSPAVRSQTLSSIAYIYDAQLFVLFQDMLDFLPSDARITELKEQNAWLDQRQKLITQAFLREQDKSAARMAASQAFIKATRSRIDEIEAKRKLVVLQ
ncbi:hypothetical protein ADIMK_3103 [Marinobacterium lacunae]|uniref:Lipoprotein n=1 Tax=Marinobacterium lacunae TaxID=1232683 RepID=A0A081FVS6_9GAMM|nr:DUF1311 domain-containing protein [Marinobacterium lacunae]KEA62631.1 hypothetical protein ADIMK_3103 [Marinobacterium lacunae]MBR9883272.1 DUF1311 domain-containing protein [Oceanospirillales bacterium]